MRRATVTPVTGQRPVRRSRWALAGLLAAGLVLGWAGAAEASPARPQRDVRCTEERPDFVPGFIPNWMLGLSIAGPWLADTRHSVTVPDDAPDWWVHEIEVDQNGCFLAQHPPVPRCSEPNFRAGQEQGGNLELPPDVCWGTYRSSHYELTWDDGGFLAVTSIIDKIQGWLTAILFGLGRSAIQLALWLVGWAFTFDITKYTRTVTAIGSNYEDNVVAWFGLEDFVWFVLLAWVGYRALRGRLTMAAGELALSIFLAAMATVMFTYRASYLDAIAERMDQTSGTLMVAARGRTPNDRTPAAVEDELWQMGKVIHREFIERPHAYLQWGPDLCITPDGGHCLPPACAEVNNNIVATGYDSDAWATRYMERTPGCAAAAAWNKEPSGSRFFAALLTMAVALVVASALGLASLTVVIAKFLIALLFAVMPFALLGAILPGTGRRLAWSWLGTLVQLVLAVVGTTFLLTLMLLGVEAVLTHTEHVGLMERWFLVLLVVGAAFMGRRRLLESTKTMGERLADTLTKATPGGAHWQGEGRGVDLLGIDRGVKRTAIAGGVTAGVVGGWAATRLTERRVARRSLRNLELMERRREGPYIEYGTGTSSGTPMGRGGGGSLGGGSLGGGGSSGGGSSGGGSSGGGGSGWKEMQRSAKVNMRTRAPRSLVPGSGGPVKRIGYVVFHPVKSLRQPYQAMADRRRLGRNKAKLRHAVRQTGVAPRRFRANRPYRRGWP